MTFNTLVFLEVRNRVYLRFLCASNDESGLLNEEMGISVDPHPGIVSVEWLSKALCCVSKERSLLLAELSGQLNVK